MQIPKVKEKGKPNGRLIGLEFENQLIYSKNGFSIKRKDIKKFWKAMVSRGWSPTYDVYTKALIGVTKEGIVLNTDTGVCNLEIAMPPCSDLYDAGKEYKKVFQEILTETKKLGFTAISLGITPRKMPNDLYSIKTEKGIYQLILGWFIRHNVQIPISSHQVCIDVPVVKVIETSNLISQIGGFLVALTANSVVENSKVRPWKELRMLYWKTPFSNKVKNISHIFGGFLVKPYIDLADYFLDIWSATPLLIIKNGEWMRLKNWKLSTLEYIESKKPVTAVTVDKQQRKVLPGKDDLNLSMMLAWNDVRIHVLVEEDRVTLPDFLASLHAHELEKYLVDKATSCYIEARLCSPSPIGEELAVPALLLGLVENTKDLSLFCDSFSWEEARELKNALSVRGMDYVFKGQSISVYLMRLLTISEKGLKKRKKGEEKFLLPLWKRIKIEKTPADITIETFNKSGVMGVIKENSY